MRSRTGLATRLPATCLITICLASVTASAETPLRFAPADNVVGLEHQGVLSVWLDAPVGVRSLMVWVDFDPGLLTSIAGEPGQVFLDTGVSLWHQFRLEAPGRWYGETVILGAEAHGTGPGQLYSWRYEGDAAGTSPIVAAEVRLFAPDGTWIPDTVLPPTTITVGDPAAVPPAVPDGASLLLHPNPFNPATRLTFSLAAPGPARLSLYDLRGRRLGILWEGVLGERPWTLDWQGRDPRGGGPLAAGVYLFRLEGGGAAAACARGVLLP